MNHGEFSGTPNANWLTEDEIGDRAMELLDDFWFVEPDGQQWDAPKGSVVDGASIPRALWSLVGPPYTGDYRRASVVHDVACVAARNNSEKRLAADRMFYHACRAGGCSIYQSILLYVGVRIGAVVPNVKEWRTADSAVKDGARLHQTEDEERLVRDYQRISEHVLARGESDDPKELERRMNKALEVVVGLKLPKVGKGRKHRR